MVGWKKWHNYKPHFFSANMAEQKKLLEIGFAEYGLTMAFKHVAMKGFPAI